MAPRPPRRDPLDALRASGYPFDSATRILDGMSGAGVFRLQSGRRSPAFAKIQDPGAPEPLSAERDRLLWLKGRLPVPKVLQYARDRRGEVLVLSGVPGLGAGHSSWRRDPDRMARLLGRGLRRIHALPIRACPFDRRLAVTLPLARHCLTQGVTDRTRMPPSLRRKASRTLLRELRGAVPGGGEDLVFTHGDYCLPNVLLLPHRVAGFVDWGRAGVADRYQDLALAIRSFAFNHARASVPAFLAGYGLREADVRKVAFYQLLDEFF